MLLFKIDEAAVRYKRWSPKHEAGNYEPNTIERNTSWPNKAKQEVLRVADGH